MRQRSRIPSRARRRIVTVILLGVASTPLWSCRQLGGVEERGHCEDLTAAPGCAACLRGACCDAAIACRGHSECAAIDACVQSSTEAGFSDCRQEHEGAFRGEYAALSSCRARSCASECGVECGGFTYWRAECAKCGNSECCTAATACGESAGCLALLYCKQNCSSIDTACHLDCERAHSSGVMSALRFTECLLQKCPGECGYLPPDLSCSHHSVWPAPIHGLGVEVEARVIVLTGGTRPHPGAIVRLCEPGDVACLQPMAEGTTDELGIVRLGVQHGSKGYLWLEGEAPTIHYLRPRPAAGGPSKRERTTYLGAAGYSVADFRAVMAHKVPVLEQKGHVFYEVLDCRGFFMPGVSVELDPHDGGAAGYYGLIGELDATATGFPANGGFLNVSPGKHTLVATRRETGECVARREIVVRAGTETQVTLSAGGCLPLDEKPRSLPGSCANRCLGPPTFPGECWCDGACATYGDCCADFAAECTTAPLPAGCIADPTYLAMCNPVTNLGCGSTESCDFDGAGFACFADGNTQTAGLLCLPAKNTYCAGGLTCDTAPNFDLGLCRKFCCTDSDCGGAACLAFQPAVGTLGLCSDGAPGGGGS
ncbi:MAG: hypothetical protein L6Q84_05555 [Polyangiaceae bacterium]|nr:hypothetical protein [Polyangiaceae bacterium]